MNKNYFLVLLSLFLTSCVKKDSSLKSIFYSKRISDMNYDETKEAFEGYKTNNRNDVAIKCLQHMIAISDDHQKNAANRLELIDLYMAEQNYEKAQQAAREYQNLYPSGTKTVQAAYNEILATFNMMNIPQRDQSHTAKTVELAKEFLEKYNNEKYKVAVKDMLNICYENLFESEVGVLDSYINKYKILESHEPPLNAAKARLTYIKENFESLVNNGSARVIDLEIKLAKAEGKENIIQEKLKELQEKHPTYLAQNI